MAVGLYDVASEHQVQAGIIKEMIPAVIQQLFRLVYLFPAVVLQYIASVKPLIGKIAELVIKASDPPLFKLHRKFSME